MFGLDAIINYLVAVVQVTFGLFLFSAAGVFLSGRWGAPWVITPRHVIRRMLDLAQIKPGETLVDLGAGDGRILIAAAKSYGAVCRGVEIDPVRWALAHIFIWRNGLRKQIEMIWGDIYRADLSDADVVTLYLTRDANSRLQQVLEEKMKPGSRVVSYAFPISRWTPILIDNLNLIFVYEIGNTGEDTVVEFV